MPYLILGLLWIAWCAVHSLLISQRVMKSLQDRLGDGMRFHRAAFNVISVLTLIPVFFYSLPLHGDPLFKWSGPLHLVQVFLAGSAIFLFITGGRHYDLLQFLGIRQILEKESKVGLTETGDLDRSGILGVIRHPWYMAGILIVWARPLDMAALVTNAVITVYLVVGARLEEKKLLDRFGDCYREYQGEVPMFVPKWKNFHGGKENQARCE